VMGIEEVITAPRSPWQNPFVERVIGSIRRECLDHVIIINDRHLRRVLSSYFRYYHEARTHLSLNKDCPETRPILPPPLAKSLPSRNSAVSTIGTNVEPPETLWRYRHAQSGAAATVSGRACDRLCPRTWMPPARGPRRTASGSATKL
jgi:hypothetical protein